MKNRSKKYLKISSSGDHYKLEVIHSQRIHVDGGEKDFEKVLVTFDKVKEYNLERQRIMVKKKYKLHEEVRGD